MEFTLSDAIAEYIEQRKQTKLEPLQKARDKVLASTDDAVAIVVAQTEYAQAAAPIEAMFEPKEWLTNAAGRAKQISLATHAPKFTHGDSKASSMLVSGDAPVETTHLVTAHLAEKAIDAVGNAAVLDVARLLKIEVNGESLIQQLQSGHVEALSAFTQDAEQLAQWQAGFKLALGDEKLSGHTLTKQLYFPLASDGKDQNYHLLCPLFSSSMAHELYQQVTATRFGDEPKAIREARRKEQYHPELDQSFPATAVQNFGGSKPLNISQLNNERSGRSFLLSCAPPSYQKQEKPPLNRRSLFDRQLSYQTRSLLSAFKVFLESLTGQESNFKIRYRRDYHYVMPLIDAVLTQAALVQSMGEHAGWASHEDCQLKAAHGLWLDVANPSAAFQAERDKGDWLTVVAQDFAAWLTLQLKSNDRYLLGDVEQNYFKKLFMQELKRLERGVR
ncbi:type I-F CRISPR-associated protein Csy1 [Shewanella sp. AS1]|uniref:type I-F CRISPR-associated protein Csy1 n=1 Tax=Shewanella sp. AS1 TaxID=2907626 RepID=UPI001F2DA029|nr:type I-F CRISPR-associated protein Csy1 [Shewanella sp. AS1]MCE9680469.1 type I-F CRISPR-associated protein Csy1 [Shewanella sp. AS1]